MTDQVQVAKMDPWRYNLADPWSSDESSELSPRDHDKYLPIYNISKIMKKGLPPYGKISKNAKETMQECVSEFISFITNAASDKCQKENRKTLHGEDVLWAMTGLGFEEYIDPLKIYLDRYREVSPRLRMPFQADKPPNNKNGSKVES